MSSRPSRTTSIRTPRRAAGHGRSVPTAGSSRRPGGPRAPLVALDRGHTDRRWVDVAPAARVRGRWLELRHTHRQRRRTPAVRPDHGAGRSRGAWTRWRACRSRRSVSSARGGMPRRAACCPWRAPVRRSSRSATGARRRFTQPWRRIPRSTIRTPIRRPWRGRRSRSATRRSRCSRRDPRRRIGARPARHLPQTLHHAVGRRAGSVRCRGGGRSRAPRGGPPGAVGCLTRSHRPETRRSRSCPLPRTTSTWRAWSTTASARSAPMCGERACSSNQTWWSTTRGR